ncbi:hypothetical protein Ddye_031735 [Dipteronia dyeriana]|uniref:non-specific serine/threonine protein kinase n=1 Tax=Dipteronia dyeriana TaxID=168575 RepID=A0AAD9TJG1_9ROSI|nr:hypothetical protein Ddye_031735 [Dipteronia dyeriana]
MHSSIFLCCFCLLLIHSFSTPFTDTIHSNETDRLALLAIKSRLDDPLGVTSSWNDSVPLCGWTGVSCGGRNQRITELDLRNQSMGGCLSPFIGNLSFLRSIRLENNNFYGDIPNEVSLLSRLETLILASNSFSGTIPNNLSHCSNLNTFFANRNNLLGEIPVEIGNLLKLERLGIGENHLTGQLPASIGNLSTLLILDISTSGLSGTIPFSLGRLRSLFYLHLGGNNISGMVPPSIFNISTLTYLYLQRNRLYGSLPRNIGNDLPRLKRFFISYNNFTGPLPFSLCNTSNLEWIEFQRNYFSGKVSIDFSRLKNLSDLYLDVNNLGTGTANDLHFLTSLINCSKLERLNLNRNQFGGVLPKLIGNLSSTLSFLILSNNQLYGSIPPEIGDLIDLYGLDMQRNQLSGTIPHEIGKLKRLQLLNLKENSLQGSIPASIGNLTLLTKLFLFSNNLKGSIPSSLGNCRNLMSLTLSKNKLTGILPQEILGITTLSLALVVSDNLLSGPFPSQLGNLKTLIAIDISKNRFSGEIPGTLDSCTSLEILYMHDNSFSGSIPSSLSSLRSIQALDLSANNLSGEIPKYLETLEFLVYLNLSFNHLEGEVPTKGIFSNKSGIYLEGNKRLCGGLAEMHLPSCPSKKSNKVHLKVVIPVIVSCAILSLAFFIIIFTGKRRSAQHTSSLLHLEELFPMVSYAELSNATDKFSSSNIIGQGSHGLVYKGILGENRMSIAVKVINLQRKGGSKSFTSECETLRNIRHRNLIKIVTICSSIDPKGADFQALVYDYMENGSLEEWLQRNKDQLDASSLSLIQRLHIAIDVAFAVEYLHHHCEPPIVHGDLKPCNILLDHDMVSHVGDFGLSKFLFDHRPLITAPETRSNSIGVRGTVGYVAPEYGMGNEVSMPGDVYSFGILLLEMFTGKRPTDSLFNDGITLHEFAKMALSERVLEIVEPTLLLEARTGNNSVETYARRLRRGEGRDGIEECLVGILRIGVVCSMKSPAERMEMSDVVAKLCAVRESFLGRRI